MPFLLALIKDVFFRIAFAVGLVIQTVLWALLVGGISALLLSHSSVVVDRVLFFLILGGLLPIGAANYFLFHRIIREEYISTEAEKWLAERRRANSSQIKRRRRLRYWAAWIPVVSVMLFCLFLDDTWPPASHLFYSNSGRLIGYKVSVPFSWAIVRSEPDSGGTLYRSYLWANRCRRMVAGSTGFFLGRRPSMSISSMSFYGDRLQDGLPSFSPPEPDGERPMSTRVYTVGNTVLSCEEFEQEDPQQLNIRCTAKRGNFFCTFNGDREDSADFYRTVARIRTTN